MSAVGQLADMAIVLHDVRSSGKRKADIAFNAPFLLLARRQMSDRELNLSVGALPPVFNDGNETALRRLMNNFADFAASCVNWQR
jgi:hypothetical protein